jgi:hypothetical protein
MLDFSSVTICNRDEINRFFSQSTYRNCDFSFSNIFCWKHNYDTTFCIVDGFLFFRFFPSKKSPGYMMPLGDGDIKHALELLMQDAEERQDAFRLHAITPEMFACIEAVFPGRFVYQTIRDWSEYIYRSQDLITLKGKKLQSKRNHVNKFKRTYSYEYLPVTKAIVPECLELYARWCRENGNCSEESLVKEKIATQTAFENFEPLGLRGGALRVEGEVVAYSYGQPLGADTFGVHAEKSLYEIEGGFSMINQQFIEHEGANFVYINREEDLGIDSLRQAKLSYQPIMLLEKGFIQPK